MVPERRPRRRGRRARPRPRGDGHPPLGLRHLGADAARDGRRDQGLGRRQRLLPALHPPQLLRGRGQARRGVRQGDGGGDPPPAREGRRRSAGARRRADRAPGGPPHLGDDHRPLVREVDQLLPRPAAAGQPVGQRRPLGAAPPRPAADDRVPLAGRAHRARRRGRGAREDHRDARGLPLVRRGGDRRPRHHRREARERALPRRGLEPLDRGDDAGRQGAPGRHLALPGDELLGGDGDRVHRRGGQGPLRAHDLVGLLDPPDGRPGDDPRRRQRPAGAAPDRAPARGDRPDHPRRPRTR